MKKYRVVTMDSRGQKHESEEELTDQEASKMNDLKGQDLGPNSDNIVDVILIKN